MARRNDFKYPECPACKTIGEKGLRPTRLEGRLKCRSCNSMFEFELDKNYNIIVEKSLDSDY